MSPDDQIAHLEHEVDRMRDERDDAARDLVQAQGELTRHQRAIAAIRALCAEAEHGRHRRDAAVYVTDIRAALEDHLR